MSLQEHLLIILWRYKLSPQGGIGDIFRIFKCSFMPINGEAHNKQYSYQFFRLSFEVMVWVPKYSDAMPNHDSLREEKLACGRPWDLSVSTSPRPDSAWEVGGTTRWIHISDFMIFIFKKLNEKVSFSPLPDWCNAF